jgi:hypothetical protein
VNIIDRSYKNENENINKNRSQIKNENENDIEPIDSNEYMDDRNNIENKNVNATEENRYVEEYR